MPIPKITNLTMIKLTLRNFSPRMETSLNVSAAKKSSPKCFPKLSTMQTNWEIYKVRKKKKRNRESLVSINESF